MRRSSAERPTFAAGVATATLAAGPVFVSATAIATGLDHPRPINPDTLWWLLLGLFPPVIVIGGLLAVVPAVIGSALMAWLGRGNVALRLPVVWAMVGGLAAGGATAALSGESDIVFAFAATGAISALLCRRGTRWA